MIVEELWIWERAPDGNQYQCEIETMSLLSLYLSKKKLNIIQDG
jgi:hypothetical protein